MSVAALRLAVVLASVMGLALLQADDGCGTVPPDPEKGEGEPCIRTSECRSPLQCQGGVCMRPGTDAGMDAGGLLDAGPPMDADVTEAGIDADVAPTDGAVDDAGPPIDDAGPPIDDAGPAPLDSGPPATDAG